MQSLRSAVVRGASIAVSHRCVAAVPVARVSLAAPVRFFSAAPKASMAAIKQLRERSGAPITECKDALTGVLVEGKVDAADEGAVMEAAVEWLRKKGISTAAKKSGRVASEGLVALQVAADGRSASLVEVNSETDFAARNTLFRALTTSVSRSALQLVSNTAGVKGELPLTDLQAAGCSDPTASSSEVPVSTAITNVVTSLRENVQVRRVAGLAVQKGVVGSYVHNAVDNDATNASSGPAVRLGRQASIVALEVSGAEATPELQAVANKLAMQVVASTPRFVSRAEVPEELLANERTVLLEQANAPPIPVPGQPIKKAGKPKDAAQLAKMIDGKINKWVSEIALLEQQYVVSGDDAKTPTVAQLLDAEAKKLGEGATVRVVAFQRFLVGEGVQTNKAADSFANEVAEKMAKAAAKQQA